MTLDTSTLWSQYCDHLSQWFYGPDLEALRILTANIYAHIHLNDQPAWIFVIGPSGSAKTTLSIYPYEVLPNITLISDITPAGFYSVDKSKKTPVHHGLIVRSGNPGNAIWLFKDFTTVLAKDHKVVSEILSRLREVHDGKFTRDIAHVNRIPWSGKITCIAAVTDAIESRLATNREFGERFMSLRWPAPPDPLIALELAQAQTGRQEEILTRSKELMLQILRQPPIIPTESIRLHPSDQARIHNLIIIGAKLAREGTRDYRQRLTSVGSESFPSRIVQGINTIMRGHALMFNRPAPGAEEISLAYRLVLDSIPLKRMALLCNIPLGGGAILDTDLIAQLSKGPNPIPKATIKSDIELLTLTGVLDEEDHVIAWSKPFLQLIKDSGLYDQLLSRSLLSEQPVPREKHVQ